MNIRNEVITIKENLINWRRDFHQYPELSFEEYLTSEKIGDYLKSMGLNPKMKVGKTGVIADISWGSGPTIALRADMDALPIQEKSGLEYSSKHKGVMHACGHDAHMAILLGVAKILSNYKKNLNGTVRFIFQPAEEGKGGARYMIKDGCLENIEEIYGLHVWNYQKIGEVGVKSGPVMAAADMFYIDIEGIGGHGAAPQGTVDSIVVASHLVQAFQTIVSRNTNPLDSTVVTVGKINGGNNFNVIADKVSIEGTARSYTEQNRVMIKDKMKQIIKGVSETYGAKINFKYKDGYPPTINDLGCSKKVLNAAKRVVQNKAGTPYLSMGGEDFAYYLQKIPGCFFFIGSAPNSDKLFETRSIVHTITLTRRHFVLGHPYF